MWMQSTITLPNRVEDPRITQVLHILCILLEVNFLSGNLVLYVNSSKPLLDDEKVPKGVSDAQYEVCDGNGKLYCFKEE